MSWIIEMLKNIKIKMISFLYKVLKPAIKVPFGLLLRSYLKMSTFDPHTPGWLMVRT
jgi:hypothetical protein